MLVSVCLWVYLNARVFVTSSCPRLSRGCVFVGWAVCHGGREETRLHDQLSGWHGVLWLQRQRLDDPGVGLAALLKLLQRQAVVIVLVHLVEDLLDALLRRVLVVRHRLLALQKGQSPLRQYPLSFVIAHVTEISNVFVAFNLQGITHRESSAPWVPEIRKKYVFIL